MRPELARLARLVLIAAALSAGSASPGWSSLRGALTRDDPQIRVVWELAQRLEQRKNHQAAVTEYLRIAYFCSDPETVARAYERAADNYRAMGDLSSSRSALQEMVELVADPAERDRIRLRAAQALMERGDLVPAETELLFLSFRADDEGVRRRAALLQLECHVRLQEWDLARQALSRYRDLTPGQPPSRGVAARVDSLLQVAGTGGKSPARARALSTVLPGAGQAYAGAWGDGLNALGLNSATGYLLVQTLRTGTVVDILMASFMFQRYYAGNRHHAALRAREHNQRRGGRLAEELIECLHGLRDGEPETAGR